MMILPETARTVPGTIFATYERNFMLLDFDAVPPLPDRPARHRIHIEKWSDHHQDNGAQLIAASYAGHIDSRINDQYRSVTGARRFLYNIVQYPGSGTFVRPASYMAFDRERGWLCSLSLTSSVGPEAGHITQICVAPQVRGTGVGYELLRRSLMTMRENGCRSEPHGDRGQPRGRRPHERGLPDDQEILGVRVRGGGIGIPIAR